MLLYLEDVLHDREGVETGRRVVNLGMSGMLLRRIRPSHWSNLSGSGLGLSFVYISLCQHLNNMLFRYITISSTFSTFD
jgi:hypothetical protein